MTQQTSPSEIARIFDAEVRDPDGHAEPGARYNVAPTQPVSVVVQRDEGRFVELHRWGLVPASSDRPTTSGRLINARAETVARTPAFRVSFQRRRCIVPADGFYEWRREGRQRQPYLISGQQPGPLAFAGLWAPWHDSGSGNWLMSAAVITTAANRALAELHDRMPVVLPRAAWELWLDRMVQDVALLEEMLRPAADELLTLRPVSPRVNSPHNEGPDLVLPYTAPATPGLFATGPG
ncbi:MAG TPA: SOS response-associated peptidase [Candidatus Caenarcaniphilales bacterium]|nr:SOS response-associated peptidase [Candidatus Caenarcaniphilales bacterium]